MPIDERLKERVISAFTRPGHPVAYSAPERVAKHFNLSIKQAREILEHVEGYTLHREYKQPRVYNPYYVHGRREQVQADLIDVGRISARNDGITFLLVLIDIFTKRIWVYPLLNKSARSMRRSMSTWVSSLDVKPKVLMTDAGLEFTNRPVQDLLRQNEIEWQQAYGTLKACVAERVNKTLQLLIYKYLSQNETARYIPALSRLVGTYNNRGHRTLQGMTPNEADQTENEDAVRAIFHDRYGKIGELRRQPKFKVGDLVRLKTLARKVSSSSRAYAEQFHGEYFNIVRINRTLPVPLYYLRSTDNGELIRGGLYANELQRQRGDIYKIEAVERVRTRGGRRYLYVKWKNFGRQHNQWIPETDVQRVF